MARSSRTAAWSRTSAQLRLSPAASSEKHARKQPKTQARCGSSLRFPDSVRSDNGPVLWALIPQHKMAQPSRIPDVSPEELAFENKPSVWDMAKGEEIPEDAWEYHSRKAKNDAVYRGLQFVPYCTTMPVTKGTECVKWMWEKKGTKH